MQTTNTPVITQEQAIAVLRERLAAHCGIFNTRQLYREFPETSGRVFKSAMQALVASGDICVKGSLDADDFSAFQVVLVRMS